MSSYQKILIIGNDENKMNSENVRIDSFAWKKIPQINHIRDYDIVIINLLNGGFPPKEEKIFKHFFSLINADTASDVYINGGKIIIIGDPTIQPEYDSTSYFLLFWTGINFEWNKDHGDTVNFKPIKMETFLTYANKLKNYKFSLINSVFNENVSRQILEKWRIKLSLPIDTKLSKMIYPLCINRLFQPIMFYLKYGIHYRNGRNDEYQLRAESGNIIFLPEIILSESDTLKIVLTDILKIDIQQTEPEWLSHVFFPGQPAIDSSIQIVQSEITKQNLQLDTLQNYREEAKECLKLIYERDFALEPVTRKFLNILGADVEDPANPNEEDGWIKVEVNGDVYEGVLEIKSTNSDQFNEHGRRQVVDWVANGIDKRGKKFKGIFIGNSAVQKPLSERPYAFSDNWKTKAEMHEICALKTEDIYIAYVLMKNGLIDLGEFWLQMFNTNGVMDTKRYWDIFTVNIDTLK